MRPVIERAVAGLVALLLVVVLGSATRIHTALTDPNFDTEHAETMLRSDPALLYYITERIIESGGLPPEDFRSDRRVQYPGTADLPGMFTVSQEFLVAWAYLAFGADTPLHVFCVWVMGIFASLAAIGVYGLTYELTAKVRWAVLAALFYAITPFNYRTIGFILIREDFSFPWFTLHLYLLARALRVRTPLSFLWAGLALALSLASWHAMGFVVLLEVAAFFLWFLRTGESPFALPWAWVVPACVAIASLVIPVLFSKLFLLSLPIQLAVSMLVVAMLDRGGAWTHRKKAVVALGTWGVLLTLSIAVARWTGGGQGDYGHVFNLLVAKIAHLGVLPDDPSELSFDARLLWHGPFATASLRDFTHGLGGGIVILGLGVIAAAPGWLRGKGDRALMHLTAFAVLCAISAWLVRRTLILPGFVAPVLGAVLLDRLKSRKLAVAIVVAAITVQGTIHSRFLDRHLIFWYANPRYNAEIAHLVQWARSNIPSDAAVAGDFVHSTALLAHNRNPIVCQPKYETVESRRRFEEFLDSYLNGTPRDFHRFAKRYRCRYVLIDRVGLWTFNRYIAGIPSSQPAPMPGTAVAAFSSSSSDVLTDVPGFTLVYRSPEWLGTDIFRVYEID